VLAQTVERYHGSPLQPASVAALSFTTLRGGEQHQTATRIVGDCLQTVTNGFLRTRCPTIEVDQHSGEITPTCGFTINPPIDPMTSMFTLSVLRVALP
jgi:hypothetical protein